MLGPRGTREPAGAATGWRRELADTLRLGLPIVCIQLGSMAMGTVDIVMIGHHSTDGLAGVALGHLYAWAIAVFGLGVLAAVDPVVSQATAANDPVAARRGVQRGLAIAVLLTPMCVLGWPAERVLEALGQPSGITHLAADYVHWSLPGILPLFVFTVFRQSLQALSRTRPVLIVIVAANALNLLLDWMLIFGALGAPALGVQGSAIATSIGRVAMAGGLLWAAWPVLRPMLLPFDRAVLRRKPLLRMLRLGAPAGAQMLLEMGVFGATALMMGWIGRDAVAGHQVALNLASLSFMIPLGLSAAASIRVGYGVGRDSLADARCAAGVAITAGTLVMAVFAVVFLVVPGPLARLYFGADRVAADPGFAVALALVPVAGVFQVFDGLQVVCIGVLRGLGNTRTPMVVNLIGFWLLGLPCGYLLAFPAGLGPPGLWWGLVVGLASVGATLAWLVLRDLRRPVVRLSFDDDAR